jgi:hypothetical protein
MRKILKMLIYKNERTTCSFYHEQLKPQHISLLGCSVRNFRLPAQLGSVWYNPRKLECTELAKLGDRSSERNEKPAAPDQSPAE